LKYFDYIFDANMALGVAKRMEPDAGVVLVWCLCIAPGGSKLLATGAFSVGKKNLLKDFVVDFLCTLTALKGSHQRPAQGDIEETSLNHLRAAQPGCLSLSTGSLCISS
jgi:hypothetical protein